MSNRNRLAAIRIPAPSAGWLPDQGARNTPPQGASALQNVRIDGGLGRSRPGRVNLVVNPPLGSAAAQTGTATFDATSTAVVGVGTLFTSEYAVGDYIKSNTHNNDAFTKVASITDNLNLVLERNYRSSTIAGVAIDKASESGIPVVTIRNETFPNETVETVLFTRLSAHRYINDAWSRITGAANAWTGTEANKFWMLSTVFAGNDRLIMSNGFDAVLKVWAGGTNDITDYTGSYGARYAVMGDDSRLIVVDTIESAVRHTQRVRWTVVGLTNGGAADWSDPGSGLLELRGDREPCRAVWKQAGRIYIGKRRSIVALLPTGIATDAYAAETLNTGGDGVFAPNSLVSYGNLVAFMTARDFVFFDGVNTNALGNEKVRDTLRKRLNKGKLGEVTSIFDEDNNRIGWGLPLDGAETPSEIWWFNIDTGAWEFDIVAHTALGPFSNVDITTVDELTGNTVDELSPTTVDGLSVPGSAFASVLYGFADGRTEKVTDGAVDDNGTNIAARYATGVLPLGGVPITIAGRQRAITPDDYLLLDSIEIACLDRGQDYTLLVEVSKNGGASWTPIGNVTVTSAAPESSNRIVERTLHKRTPLGSTLMVRLSNVTTNIKWGWADFTIWADVVGRKR